MNTDHIAEALLERVEELEKRERVLREALEWISNGAASAADLRAFARTTGAKTNANPADLTSKDF